METPIEERTDEEILQEYKDTQQNIKSGVWHTTADLAYADRVANEIKTRIILAGSQ